MPVNTVRRAAYRFAFTGILLILLVAVLVLVLLQQSPQLSLHAAPGLHEGPALPYPGHASWWIAGLVIALAAAVLFNLCRLYHDNITQANARQSAERFAAMKNEFVATISHEIRTPLCSVIGFAELLQQTPPGKAQQELAEGLQLSARMLLSVVNNVLDHSRLERGALSLAHEQFAPAGVINAVVKSLAVQAAQKQLQLLLHIHFNSGAQLWGDAFRLGQVLNNLVANAIRFTDKGSVTINASLQQQAGKALLQVSVTDTGSGIAAEDLQHIFEPYRQAGQPRFRYNGTGLGLAITRQIIDLHGGCITVSSTPGQGSEFRIAIPYAAVPEPAPPAAAEDVAPRPHTTPRNGARATAPAQRSHTNVCACWWWMTAS